MHSAGACPSKLPKVSKGFNGSMSTQLVLRAETEDGYRRKDQKGFSREGNSKVH